MSAAGYQMVPDLFYITGITNAQQAVTTFSAAHNYTNGEWISFRVSSPFGMVQINNQKGLVVNNDTFTVTVNIDTTQYNAFVYAGTNVQIPAICVPVASGIIPNSVPPTINLQDAFDNVRT